MKNNALISIIVPVYNSEQYLEKCVNSLIRQTHKNIEIILVDDGSTDRSAEICDSYLDIDDRIVVHHQKNTGQAGARNYGLSIARGDYVGFVDSDDWVGEDMYEVMLDAIIENDADISVCGRFSVVGDVIKESKIFKLDGVTVMDTEQAVKRFLTYDAIDSSSCDKLYKKEVLKDVRYPLGYICEDVPFVYDAITNSKRIVHCARPFYYYLHRVGSTSRSRFSTRTMGIYHYFKAVCEKTVQDFPALTSEAEYLYYKNLIVLADIIAGEKSKLEERRIVNAEIRRNIVKILRCRYLRPNYKLLSVAVWLRLERILITIGRKLGVKC